MKNEKQQQIALKNNGCLVDLSNTISGTSASRPDFDAAHITADMVINEGSTIERTIAWGKAQVSSRPHVIDFAGHSYLGLDNHPVIVAEAIEAIEAHRSLHCSCARKQLCIDLIRELEEVLSEMFCARILVFSSGMLANASAMSMLALGRLTGGRKPVVVFDRSARVSLTYHKPIVAEETRVEAIVHNDIEALERLCRENQVVAYVCDCVCCIGGYSPIKELLQLQDRYGLFLYIDDAHGLSICGRKGEGLARSQFPQVLGDRTIIAASLAKAFGASGGVLMVGTADHEARFRRYCIPYGVSVISNLAAIGAALGSCKIHRSTELGQRQRRLAQRVHLFDRRIATAEQGNMLPIRTMTIGSEISADAVARELLDRGFYIPVADFSPVGQGKAGIRACITAEHKVHEIEQLCEAILRTITRITTRPYPLR